MYITRLATIFLLIVNTIFITKADLATIWVEGHVKSDILKVHNHQKSRSTTIALLVTKKSSILFQASTNDLKNWYFILDNKILESLKKVITEDEIFNWEVFNISLIEPIKKNENCKLQDLYISCFYSHITKETVRHLVSSHDNHIIFAQKIKKNNVPLIEGLLEGGNDGYIYLTREPILAKYIKGHKGILSSFFIFESNKIKTCW